MAILLGMEAIRWEEGVYRYTTTFMRPPRCAACKMPYTSFIEFRLRVSTSRPEGNNATVSVNLPCWHIDPITSDVEGRALGFAPDVQARLLLVAEDADGV